MNTKYVGDITYLAGGGKFRYLATVIDLASRRLAGWAIADHLRAELVIDALAAAERTRGSLAQGGDAHRSRTATHESGIRRSMQVSRGSAEHGRGWVQRGQRRRGKFQRDLQKRDAQGPDGMIERARHDSTPSTG
ncbi:MULTISPECIES: DDE-type integrase/transposase/recombinase [unclassified Streptomyces]|uniref:DDE-type integrase/transposase/recombinase n=1 Tax=unclassified Streptomyces TaxID=2593676 RepID=UPI00352D066C